MKACDYARCDQCPLKKHWQDEGDWEPVDAEVNTKGVLILGDAPSKLDVELRRPFSDMHGATVLDELKALGVPTPRKAVSWGSAIACRWPKDDPQTYAAKLRSMNRKRLSQGKSAYPSPVQACAPYRERLVDMHQTVIPMGDIPTKAVLGGNPSLEAVRGGPTYAGSTKALPTYHPRVFQKQPKLLPVFRRDLSKALRHHKDKLRWTDPIVHYNPSPERVKSFFARARQEKWTLTYDVETDSVDSLTADLRCVGIGTDKEVLILGFVSIDGTTRFYSPSEEEQIRSLLREVFEDVSILIAGHNAGYFDRLVSESHRLGTPAPLLDTVLLHKLASSEYPHRLGFVSSYFLDTPAWKADHTAVTAKTDKELHEYCAVDVAATARIIQPIRDLAKSREQLHLYKHDAKVQSICAGMKKMGIRIDEGKRFAHEQRLIKEAARWINVIHEYVPGMNPNSNRQIQDLFFNQWHLPIQKYTATGEPSVDASVLRGLVGNPLVDQQQRDFVNALRFWRRAEKQLSTYVYKLAPNGEFVRDGYVYPDFLAHGTVTGRLSSKAPNFQNIPYGLRDCFVPPPGCVFVGADYDQLELRFCAGLAGADHYLDAFEKKLIDPHNLTADLMFGEKFWSAQGAPNTRMGKGTGQFKQLRNLAKTICFASLYGASAPKVHEIIGRAEDNEGNLLYAHYNLRQIRALHKRWKQKAPEFKAWWDRTLRACRHDGYVEEVVLRRRRYFHKEDYNAILNFPVQAGGFNVVALAMIDLVENHIPFDFGQRTGMVNQLHDAVLFSVPESEADYFQEVVTRVMTRTVEGLPVTFTASAEIGNNWKEV